MAEEKSRLRMLAGERSKSPVPLSQSLRAVLATLDRVRAKGVRFRLPEERWDAVLRWIREEYPDATREQCLGPLAEFEAAMEVDERCSTCREPWMCPGITQRRLERERTICGVSYGSPMVHVVYGPGFRCRMYAEWKARKDARKAEGEEAPKRARGFVPDD